jgi:hypothetical protein
MQQGIHELQNKLNFNGDKLKALEKLTMEVVKAS